MSKLASNLKLVLESIQNAAKIRPDNLKYFQPRLVAVSKFKTIEDIIEIYQNGQRHFGENYINELYTKSTSESILKNCPEIKWHFIGNLQSNKINKLTAVPNLFLIETVDSIELADKLNKSWAKKSPNKNLKIMIQVNTSGEDQKNGIEPEAVRKVYSHILANCTNLDLVGLMTIGSLDTSTSQNDINKDFQTLVDCKQSLVKNLKISFENIELSMGMSNDFDKAILMGSHSVRIGTSIFGSRK